MEFSKIIIEATEALDRMLKSDESQKVEKDFTQHLLRALKIRESKRKPIKMDFFETDIIDAETHEVNTPDD